MSRTWSSSCASPSRTIGCGCSRPATARPLSPLSRPSRSISHAAYQQSLRYAEDVRRLYHQLQRAIGQSLLGLANALEAKDPYTRGHSERVAALSRRVASALGLTSAVVEALAIDLVFLDVHLPDLSGLDVCRALRANARVATARIVMLTAAAQQDDVVRGLAAGADDYLTKPFSPVRLLSLVDRLMPGVAWRLE